MTIVLSIAVALVVLVVSTAPDDAGGVDPISDEMITAYAICQRHVLDDLRTPATADFPALAGGLVQADANREGPGFRFRSFVDAQNLAGATVRQTFYCISAPTAAI